MFWMIGYLLGLVSSSTTCLAFHLTPIHPNNRVSFSQSHIVPASNAPVWYPQTAVILHSHDENSSETPISSGGRAGGRTKKINKDEQMETFLPLKLTLPNLWDKLPHVMKNIILPIGMVLALIKFLLGILFGPSPSSVVYYQSTVYETRSYDENGKMETVRKESFKSNMPELVRGSRSASSIDDRSLLDSKFMTEFDRELNQEFTQMERIMKDLF